VELAQFFDLAAAERANYRALVFLLLLATTCSLSLGFGAALLLHFLGFDLIAGRDVPTLSTSYVITAIVIAPVVETLLVAATCAAMATACRIAGVPLRSIALTLSSALVLSGLHAIFNVSWAVAIFLPLFVMAHTYVQFLIRGSARMGFVVCASVHALHNTVVLLALATIDGHSPIAG
jgi:uncharacterized membrane protein